MPRNSSKRKTQEALDFSWDSDVLPNPSFEPNVMGIYGQEISNKFIDSLNGMSSRLGGCQASAILAALQGGVAAGNYLAYTMKHGELYETPANPIEVASSVVAHGFLQSPYNMGNKEVVPGGSAPYGLGDEPSVHGVLINKANYFYAKERMFPSGILTGMLRSVGHFTAYASRHDCFIKNTPDLQLLAIRSVFRMMEAQYQHVKKVL